MVQAGRPPGSWQSIRSLPGRTPLRVKLIAALLALVAVALLVISVAGFDFLETYLLGQANSQLYALSGSRLNQNNVQDAIGSNRILVVPAGIVVDWLPNGGKAQQISKVGSSFTGPFTQSNLPGPEVLPGSAWLTSGKPVTISSASGQVRWQVVSVPQVVPTSNGPVAGTVIYGWNVTSVYQTIGRLAGIDVIVSVVLLAGLAVVGIAVVRRSLRPLTDIEQTAGAIAAGDLSRRVPERDPRTEVGRLGRSLNAMLSQIETGFQARSQSEASARRSEEKMRQFVADASHELRTPLTAIRGFAEYYRQRGGVDTGGTDSGQLASADLDRIMRRVEQEASRMGILVEDMLLLARLDQQRPLEARPVDLLSLAADAVHDARVVAPDRSINLTVGSGAALLVIGDEVRLRQVIGNLMSNALTHTPGGSPIDVLIRSGNLDEAPVSSPPPPPPPADLDASTAADSTADGSTAEGSAAGADTAADTTAHASTADPGTAQLSDVSTDIPARPAGSPLGAGPARPGRPAAVLEVTDHGPGLTREHAEHVFERFYRADQSRTAGGSGLGLAIVAALVAAHGGVAWVRSQPGAGATFCIALPLSPDAAQGGGDDLDAEDMPDNRALDDGAAHGDSAAHDNSEANDGGTADSNGGQRHGAAPDIGVTRDDGGEADGSGPDRHRADPAWRSADSPDRVHGHVT